MQVTPLTLATTDTLRAADLDTIVALLKSQADVKYDVVVNAASISYDQGTIAITGGAARISDDGVEDAVAYLRPTQGCERQVAERLNIPAKYMAAMRVDAVAEYERGRALVLPEYTELDARAYHLRIMDEAAHLLDHNVNHWLTRNPRRKFLIRGFRTDNPDEIGVARAMLSDGFGMIDHLDVLVAALDGVRQSGAEITIEGCDLSERRMRVLVSAPSIMALAPTLLKGYRNPFRSDGLVRVGAPGQTVVDETGDPVVFAGFAIENSETGGGAFTLTPRVIVKICNNGMTMKADALRQVHLGSKLDEGVVRWSHETNRKALDLVTAKARDAVATFLDVGYVERVVADLEALAGAPIRDTTQIVERVAKNFGFTQSEQDTILSAFITSGQITAGGVMQAVTAAAQTVADPDRAAELEASAVDVLEFAAR